MILLALVNLFAYEHEVTELVVYEKSLKPNEVVKKAFDLLRNLSMILAPRLPSTVHTALLVSRFQSWLQVSGLNTGGEQVSSSREKAWAIPLRPKNAFFMFYDKQRSGNPRLTFKAVSQSWNALDQASRDRYKAKAIEEYALWKSKLTEKDLEALELRRVEKTHEKLTKAVDLAKGKLKQISTKDKPRVTNPWLFFLQEKPRGGFANCAKEYKKLDPKEKSLYRERAAAQNVDLKDRLQMWEKNMENNPEIAAAQVAVKKATLRLERHKLRRVISDLKSCLV